jgi:hypothetical protein
MNQYTHPLYVSPAKDKNRKKYGEGDGNYCICCYLPMKPGETKMVHMNEDWLIVSNDVTDENCEALTGAKSQGCFNIGDSCAKKHPQKFIISY